MPYIPEEKREKYKKYIDDIVFMLTIETSENDAKGELNFIIFSIVKGIIEQKGIRYFRLQDLIGTLECCKLEIYRRLIAPYEDKAIEKNGDIEYGDVE